eukprot:scaffold232027_cov44-Prasinocladus_malaysianus.AAC.1
MHAAEHLFDIVAAARAGLLSVVREAVNGGCNVNATDVFGQTALMCMAGQGQLEMVQFLLFKGADPWLASAAPGRKGMSALDYCCMEQTNSATSEERLKYAKIGKVLQQACSEKAWQERLARGSGSQFKRSLCCSVSAEAAVVAAGRQFGTSKVARSR